MKLHSLGEQLRAARIKKELSLYDVEKISGVEAQFLLAMEMDQLKALPEDIQQEALEKYANSVGLDGKRLFEEQKQNEQKLKKEKKPVERKEDTLAAKAPMSRFLKHKREEKRKSNYLPLLILSAVSLLIICSVGYIIIRHLSNQPQVIKPNIISTVNHLSTASKAKSSRSISEVTVSGANVTTTTQGNQLMVDFSNVNSSVVLDVELSENNDDTWFSVDNSETSESSESYLLSKTKNSKYSLDFSDKTKPTQIIIAQSSKVTLKVNGESLDLSQLDKNTPSYLTLRIQ
ncbi:MAG: helix-turn-helix domain-containing protein [Streptococcus salivarius]